MEVVWDLRRAPDREPPVWARLREGYEGLREGVSDPGERPAHSGGVRRVRERRIHVAEALHDLFLDVRPVEPAGVDRLGHLREPRVRVGVLGERLRIEADQGERLLGCPLVARGDGRNDVPDVPGLVYCDSGLVVGHRQDPERDRVSFARQHRIDPGQRSGRGHVDRSQPGVRPGASQDAPDQLARPMDVVGVFRPARDLEGTLDVGDPRADEAVRRGGGRRHQPPPREAASIASTILM